MSDLCTKTTRKISALARVAFMNFDKRKLLMNVS